MPNVNVLVPVSVAFTVPLTGIGLPESFLISTSGRLEIATVPVIVHGEVPWYTVEVVGKLVIAMLVLLNVIVLIVILGIELILTVLVKLLATTVPVIVHGEVPWNTVEVVGKFVTAKLVLEIVRVLLTNTVEVKLVTVTDVGKLSTRTVEVKLLTITVPVMAGKLLTATVPLTAGRLVTFTFHVPL